MDELLNAPHGGESPKKEATVLKEVKFLPGLEDRVGYFESFKELPVVEFFSWGKDSANMSPIYAGTEGPEGVRQRIKGFVESVGIEYKNNVNTAGLFEGTHLQMQEITMADVKDQPTTKVEANFVFTKDPNILLSIQPGDCWISILFAKDREGKEIVGIIHSSALSTNAGLPRYAIDFLTQEEGVDPASIHIGITPGVSSNHYWLNEEPHVVDNESFDRVIVERNWKEHIAPKDPNQGDEQQRSVDILSATMMQLIEAGVKPENIESYDIDNYTAAEEGVSHSNRYSKDTNKPQGRYMVAIKLKG